MHKLIQFVAILLLTMQIAAAQERQIQILNPDGTPATDAKVVAVLSAPGGIVDQDLKPLQVSKVNKQLLSELINENGTVTPGDAKAIVASNEQGFLFLPASAFGEKAKLREWARVELDVSTIPEEKRTDEWLSVTWTNNIGGSYVLPSSGDFRDAFHVAEELNGTEADWRFERMIVWRMLVPAVTQSLSVPPGEITISVGPESTASARAKVPLDLSSATLGLWRVPSSVTTRIALPGIGSFEGKLSERDDIPDWSRSGGEIVRIMLTSPNPSADPMFRELLQPSGSFDKYAAKLNSNEGFEARRSGIVSASGNMRNGQFSLNLVPVGNYIVGKLVRLNGPPEGRYILSTFAISSEKRSMPVNVQIHANETLKMDLADVEILIRQPAAIDPPRFAPDLEPPSAPISIHPGKLPPGAQVAYKEITHVVDGKEVKQVVPYIVHSQKAPLNDPAMTPFERPVNREDKFSQPENDLYFEADVPPTPDPKPDAATTFIQNWLRTAKDPADQTELRKLLQDHLQQEFDANQKSRQAEIERLQQLLGKSKEWLNQRQQRRDEIIRKRIEELLQQQALPKAEASGRR